MKEEIFKQKVTSLEWNCWDSLLSIPVLLPIGRITSYSPLTPTATSRERLKLNTPNATLVLHFRLQKTLGWPVQETDLNPKSKPKGAKSPWGPWSSVFKTS